MLDSIIAEHVLDIPFRRDLERKQGFCRRHLRELIEADRRETGGILGSSILYGAMLERRLELLRGAIGTRGRGLRTRLAVARKRPPCIACEQGASAVETALARLVERSRDPDWAAAIGDRAVLPRRPPGALDGGGRRRRRSSRSPGASWTGSRTSRVRLEGFVDHSAHDRRHRLTDLERGAAREAADALGGAEVQPAPTSGRDGPVRR